MTTAGRTATNKRLVGLPNPIIAIFPGKPAEHAR